MSTDNTKMSENAITPSVLNKMFGRALMYGASWNYERMQNLGFLYMMVSRPQEDVQEQHPRHGAGHEAPPGVLQYPSDRGPLHRRRRRGDGGERGQRWWPRHQRHQGRPYGSACRHRRLPRIWLTLVPICFSIGASYSAEGGLLGVAIALF